MIDLKKYNYAHYGELLSIELDFDIGNWDKRLELRIKYRMTIDKEEADGSFKCVGYNYYKMIFISPSHYFINIKTKQELPTKEEIETINCYNCDDRYIYEIKEIESYINPVGINHTHWKIKMCSYDGYIDIFADDLIIEKIETPHKT